MTSWNSTSCTRTKPLKCIPAHQKNAIRVNALSMLGVEQSQNALSPLIIMPQSRKT